MSQSRAQLAMRVAEHLPQAHQLEWWEFIRSTKPSRDDLLIMLESVQSLPKTKSVASRQTAAHAVDLKSVAWKIRA